MIDRTVRYARTWSSSVSVGLLIAFNLVPLVGVLFLGWSIATILVLYWVENGIVGLLNVPKILLARGSDVGRASAFAPGAIVSAGLGAVPRVAQVGFFLVHYGIFWLVHGVFVFALPTFAAFGGTTDFATPPDGTFHVADPSTTAINMSAVVVGAVGFAISRGASFVVNYVGQREYLRVSPMQQMFAPYGRLLILHLTIIFGAFVSLMIGTPVGAIVVLVLVKTVGDLALHVREHERLAPSAGST